jgi:hypothetical protein
VRIQRAGFRSRPLICVDGQPRGTVARLLVRQRGLAHHAILCSLPSGDGADWRVRDDVLVVRLLRIKWPGLRAPLAPEALLVSAHKSRRRWLALTS